MYDNIGEKIKDLAKGIFVIVTLGTIITGIALLATDDDFILFGLLILFCGPIVALISSWILYAFGKLVEDVHAIRNKESSDIKIETDPKHQTQNNQNEVKREKINPKKRVKTISANINTLQQKAEMQKEEPQKFLPCPECGENLDFMGWSDEELKEKKTCPLCGKEISLNQ